MAGNPVPSASVTQPKGKLPATHIPEMHGRKTVGNCNRFPIKILFAINCTQKHLLLLPLLSLFRFTSSSPQELPLHLLCCNFLKALSFFSPVLAHVYCWHHLCSLSAPVLTNTAHSDSLCPLNPSFPLRGPHHSLADSGDGLGSWHTADH